MKTIVIYNSKTGFTQKYGEWIAEELGCEAVPYKKALKQLDTYELIIFGGWILGGKVTGLDELKKTPSISGKQLAVYATGATPHNADEIVQGFKAGNLSEEEQKTIPFFYFESGINFEKMGFFSKTILKTMKKMMEKKADPTDEEKGMLKLFEASSDQSDKAYINPLLEYVKGMQ